MSFQVDFAFFDLDEPIYIFLVNFASMSIMWACISYCFKKLLVRIDKLPKRKQQILDNV
jgi:hypothetical protein